jgi:hypothetical protein
MIRHRLSTLGILTLIALLCACARSTPRDIPVYDPDGNPLQLKRVDRNPEIDYWSNWRRAAYRPPVVTRYPQSFIQDTLVAQWGWPQWMRTFVSLDNERVEEWLYSDLAAMFQFVGDNLVFEGPITDLERLLLRRGRPDRAMVERVDPDTRVEVYTYSSLFGVRLDDFHFSNGILTQSKEGN